MSRTFNKYYTLYDLKKWGRQTIVRPRGSKTVRPHGADDVPAPVTPGHGYN